MPGTLFDFGFTSLLSVSAFIGKFFHHNYCFKLESSNKTIALRSVHKNTNAGYDWLDKQRTPTATVLLVEPFMTYKEACPDCREPLRRDVTVHESNITSSRD